MMFCSSPFWQTLRLKRDFGFPVVALERLPQFGGYEEGAATPAFGPSRRFRLTASVAIGEQMG